MLKTRKVDSIQDGYEMLTNHQDMFKKLPIITANLLNNFEFALRKSASLPTRLVSLLLVFDRESHQILSNHLTQFQTSLNIFVDKITSYFSELPNKRAEKTKKFTFQIKSQQLSIDIFDILVL